LNAWVHFNFCKKYNLFYLLVSLINFYREVYPNRIILQHQITIAQHQIHNVQRPNIQACELCHNNNPQDGGQISVEHVRKVYYYYFALVIWFILKSDILCTQGWIIINKIKMG